MTTSNKFVIVCSRGCPVKDAPNPREVDLTDSGFTDRSCPLCGAQMREESAYDQSVEDAWVP